MAKYIIEYEIHVGDTVMFGTNPSKPYQLGIVQDISQMPDIWVEGFENGKYKRWRRGIDSLEIVSSDFDSGIRDKVKITEGEPIEFIHEGDVDTEEYNKLKYTFFRTK